MFNCNFLFIPKTNKLLLSSMLIFNIAVSGSIVVTPGSSPSYWQIIGNNVVFKRPGLYTVYETAGGDIGSITCSYTGYPGDLKVRVIDPSTGNPGARNVGQINLQGWDGDTTYILNSSISGSLGSNGSSYAKYIDYFSIGESLQGDINGRYYIHNI